MGRITTYFATGIKADQSLTARCFRFAPSNHAVMAAWAEQTIRDMAAETTPRYLADMDIDGGSDDEMMLVTLLFTVIDPAPMGGANDPGQDNVRVRTCYASEAVPAQAGLNALIAAADASVGSDIVYGHAVIGCGQGHQFVCLLLTGESSVPPP